MWSGGGDGMGRESYGSSGSNGYTCLQTVASIRTLFSRHHRVLLISNCTLGPLLVEIKTVYPRTSTEVFENYALLSSYCSILLG